MSNTDMTALLKQGEAESLRRQKIVQMALRIVVWAAAAITRLPVRRSCMDRCERSKSML